MHYDDWSREVNSTRRTSRSCRISADLNTDWVIRRKPVPLDASHLPQPHAGKKPILLKSLTHHAGVNALAQNQKIEFGPRLTVVYGANAAGKSRLHTHLETCVSSARCRRDSRETSCLELLPDAHLRPLSSRQMKSHAIFYGMMISLLTYSFRELVYSIIIVRACMSQNKLMSRFVPWVLTSSTSSLTAVKLLGNSWKRNEVRLSHRYSSSPMYLRERPSTS